MHYDKKDKSKMDICSFINSKSIREYLHEIKYDFNAKEAAWLINQCNLISIEEKHEAWKQLMQEIPDFKLGERFDFLPDNSLYELLRRNIKYQNEQLELFNKGDKGAVYQYRFYCPGDSEWTENYDGVYASIEECWDKVEEDMDLGIEVIDIRKKYISTNGTITVRFTPSRVAMNINSYKDEGDDESLKANFDEMWFDFPVPFKKGDILVPVHTPGPNNLWSETGPFVMDSITPWEKELNERMQYVARGDSSDMLAWGYFQDPDGRIYRECRSNYMNLEYYEGSFCGPRRLLIALSNFMKNEISVEMLLSAYRKTIMDEINDDVMLHSWYSMDTLRKCGLEDVIEENTHHLVESGLNPNMNFYKRYQDNKEYNWDNNQELFEKCKQIASNYHQPKEMLYIYGKHGCGKTTILQCLGNYAMQLSFPKLLYTTAENFMNEVIVAVRSRDVKALEEFRMKYRKLDFLIFDDIQKLSDIEDSFEEFTNTLNDLLTKGAQVVISADRPLDELKLPDALKSKISCATQMEMQDFETL